MITAILFLLALLEVALGAGILASGKSSLDQVLGINLIGFGVLIIALAGILGELRRTRREAAKERQVASEERLARAAFDLQQRSRMISSVDRQQRQAEGAGRPGPEETNKATAVNVGRGRKRSRRR
jgi:hypothetical protein